MAERLFSGAHPGHDLGVSAAGAVPSYAALVSDLQLVREKGLPHLRRLRLVALDRAARACDLTTSDEPEPAAIEALLRQAVERLGGGRLGDAAAYTFGLVQGTKDWPAQDRRAHVAQLYGVTPDRARKAQEPTAIEQTAEEVLNLCHEHQLRDARMQLERQLPTESRLAVQWVERFEAYNRIWTPATHLSNDLRAAIQTRREPDSEFAPWDPTQPWPGREGQARKYAGYALFAYAQFNLEVKKFCVRHGGLWLLSSRVIEEQVSDAVYRIGWHNNLTEADDSWLRLSLAQAAHEEQVSFSQLVEASPEGAAIHAKWQQLVASCACVSDDQPQPDCQVHATVQACEDYVRLIDEDWDRIADWYHAGERRPPRIEAEDLYQRLVRERVGKPARIDDNRDQR
ncbi:hypothetical protein [Amycolatopsis sp. cmx-4-68]|uniref:hypothetical protein n=1 Tax=Amycolatopsis sp. cmx-4-68 TaxID=2790938 RepID=UPI00397E05B1